MVRVYQRLVEPYFFLGRRDYASSRNKEIQLLIVLLVLCSATPTVDGDHLVRVTRFSQAVYYITCSAVGQGRGS